MTVIFLPRPSHTNTFRHIEPNWTCLRAWFTWSQTELQKCLRFTEPDESKSLRFRTKPNRDRSKSRLKCHLWFNEVRAPARGQSSRGLVRMYYMIIMLKLMEPEAEVKLVQNFYH